MSVLQYDPTNWLVTAMRSLGSYVETLLDDPDVSVEMSFPDTTQWGKQTPLDKILVHFEQDDISDPVFGFGVPSILVDNHDGTVREDEIAKHIINFDVGVWVSAEMGGVTKRMEVVQSLKNMFATSRGRTDLSEQTGGLRVVSFEGGANVIDRINDIPVWRAMNMMLLVEVISRHVPADPNVLVDDVFQGEHLTIRDEDGTDDTLVTP